ncbi:hypothetical protein JAAARDRAFT_593998 [Jaapia argillacea MUCL 33604]|uniref:Uncharacterized protein n=1 Tax=Jaapia argillacea MUCL 33604 TaxID=933084 RepID=A0A067Q1J8_9AGAM|nr:hypothetical protein JAAARDRAFT_593998 [Jaapia argillacea MUCL 33604]
MLPHSVFPNPNRSDWLYIRRSSHTVHFARSPTGPMTCHSRLGSSLWSWLQLVLTHPNPTVRSRSQPSPG